MRVVHRKSCRICGNTELTEVFVLEPQHLQGLFVKKGYPDPPLRKIPIELLWCDTTKKEDACGLLQLSKTIPPDILYNTYWYRSGTNTTMINHLRSIVDKILPMVPETDHHRPGVLDIGCNDGTMLDFFPPNFVKYGVDPSNAVFSIKAPGVHVIKDAFPTTQLPSAFRFDVITSIAMMYDLETPLDTVNAIGKLLSQDGIWVFEMSYMPTMLEMNAFDTICNEHLEYYSLSVIEYMLERCGMKLIDAELNDINGGSIQCMAIDKGCDRYPIHHDNLNKLRILEFEMALDTVKPYKDFGKRIDNLLWKLRILLHELKSNKKTIHVYGASTKGNTLLQAVGVTSDDIPYAADRNPDKWGAKTLGTNIQIISEEESRAMKPDYYLVLPWHFKEEFLIREKEAIDSGIKFIFPLPTPTIYPQEEM